MFSRSFSKHILKYKPSTTLLCLFYSFPSSSSFLLLFSFPFLLAMPHTSLLQERSPTSIALLFLQSRLNMWYPIAGPSPIAVHGPTVESGKNVTFFEQLFCFYQLVLIVWNTFGAKFKLPFISWVKQIGIFCGNVEKNGVYWLIKMATDWQVSEVGDTRTPAAEPGRRRSVQIEWLSAWTAHLGFPALLSVPHLLAREIKMNRRHCPSPFGGTFGGNGVREKSFLRSCIQPGLARLASFYSITVPQ